MVQKLHNFPFVFICIICICFHFDIGSSWVLTSNDGDITLLGPVLVEPSYGQEATITLRRNSTSMWTMGNYQTESDANDKDTNLNSVAVCVKASCRVAKG